MSKRVAIPALVDKAREHGVMLWVDNGELRFRGKKGKFPEHIKSQLTLSKKEVINFLIEEAEVPLSFSQERLWFIEQYEQGTNAYHIPMVLKLSHDTEILLLERSIQYLTKRHEILRTTIKQDSNKRNCLYVLEDSPSVNHRTSLTETKFMSQLKEDVNKIFDLSTEHPIRVVYYETDTARYLLMNIHHIAFDGWSANILLKELHTTYEAFLDGKIPDLPVLSIQYKDFSRWQRSFLRGSALNDQIEYWKKELHGVEPLNFPTDHTRKALVDYQGHSVVFEIGQSISKKLKQLGKSKNHTLYSVLLSAFYLLLYKYTGQSLIVIGTLIANRQYPQLQGLIGFFVNTLALAQRIHPGITISKFINNLSEKVIEAQLYQDIPFEQLINVLEVEQDPSRHPIFQMLFSMQSFGQEEFSPHFRSAEFEGIYQVAKFDLSLYMSDKGETLQGSLNYSTALFKRETIDRVIHHYKNVLEVIANSVETSIEDLQILNKQEFQKIVYQWNQTKIPFPNHKSYIHLFQEQVNRQKKGLAVKFKDQSLSYEDLNRYVECMAAHIRQKYYDLKQVSLKFDTPIAIILDRSIEMIVSILAILRAGGAFVPIDPDYPEDRILYILKDTESPIVLTSNQMIENLKLNDFTSVTPVIVDDKYSIDQSIIDNMNLPQPTDLSYLIYTSGTTGNPKGVQTTHIALVNRLIWMERQYSFSESDKILQKTPYVFDVSVWELLLPLMCGAQLIFSEPGMHGDPEYLSSIIEQEQITKMHFVPSMLQAFLDFNKKHTFKEELSSLTDLFCSGEVLQISTVSEFKNKIPDLKLHNLYGPTEVAIDVTSFNDLSGNEDSILIGKPINNIQCYVLDADKKPVPIGVVGELYIGGIGPKQGYLNLKDLTQEKFILNPFFKEKNQKIGWNYLFKSGDLVRYRPDGNIEYIGRNDFQIKIRGLRVEIGEIEHALSELDGIQQTAVVLQNDRQLVGYYVSEQDIDTDDISSRLSERLPNYMVPTAFIKMQSFPLTSNGKLDRKALPLHSIEDRTDIYIAPVGEIQKIICRIWQEVLGIEQIGVRDDFFKVGGDSILSIRIVAKMRQAGMQLSVRDIFIYRTIEEISRLVPTRIGTDHDYRPFSLIESDELDQLDINSEDIEDVYPVSYLQIGMFHESELIGDGTYHDVFSYQINQLFQLNRVEKIFQSLVDKHAMLRTAFLDHSVYGMVCIQHSYLNVKDKIFIKTGDPSLDDIFVQEKNKTFVTSEPGLFRVLITEKTNTSFRLIFSFHHAITDGWSVASLISEFSESYMNHSSIKRKSLPFYGEYVYHEQLALNNQENKAFWTSYLVDLSSTNRPLKLSQTSVIHDQSNDVLETSYSLVEKQSDALHNLSDRLEVSVDTVFMSLYQVLISTFFNQSDVILGWVTNNRLEKEGGDELFGLHLNTIPIRQSISGVAGFDQTILNTKANREEVELHKAYPYGKIKSDLKTTEDLYQCAFNYIHYHIIEKQYVDKKITNPKGFEKTNIPLVFNVLRMGKDFHVILSGHEKFIDMECLEKIKSYLVDYLIQLTEQTDRSYQLRTIPRVEMDQVLYQWNETNIDFPRNKTIPQLFEEQVAKYPNHIAVIHEETKLTYIELDKRSNGLAQFILEKIMNRHSESFENFSKNQNLFGLCLDRGIDTLIAILAILKIGGAYVPLDPKYPSKRIRYILDDTKIRCIVTQSRYIHLFNNFKEEEKENQEAHYLITIDKNNDLMNQDLSVDLSKVTQYISAENPAYIIYTSGTTGHPKGSVIPHRALVNLIIHQSKILNVKNQSTILQYSSTVFDASVWEIFLAIMTGSKLHIIPERIRRDALLVVNYLIANGIEIALLPPSLLQTIRHQPLTSLHTLIVGGESCPQEVIEKWSKGRAMFNAYGPTENTVCATMHRYQSGDSSNVIGKPIDNVRTYILNSKLSPVPIGVVGELYISGLGLTKGYLNRPALNQEKFISNPFIRSLNLSSDKDHQVLYKTGDLVRWLSTGSIEYVERIDLQVKIRGHRIELREIEACLLSHAQINQAVVMARHHQIDDGVKHSYLVAYYISDTILESDILKEYVGDSLPDYMIPNRFIRMESFPLTLSGKIDYEQLPSTSEFVEENLYKEPTSELEETLCTVWKDLFGLEKVGINDDFFRLGGDSILSIQLSNRLRELDLSCRAKDIFECRTIEKLAIYLSSEPELIESSAEQGVLVGQFDLLPIQSWFFDQVNANRFKEFNHWNQTILIKTPNLDLDRLRHCLQKLSMHHDMLRTKFYYHNGIYRQEYLDNINLYELKTLDISKVTDAEKSSILTQWQNHFDVKKGPLWQAGYIFGYNDDTARVYLGFHHLITDAISCRILIRDLNMLYDGGSLPAKSSSFRQWVETVSDYPNNNIPERKFWKHFVDTIPSYEEFSRSAGKYLKRNLTLSKHVTRTLIKLAHRAYHTQINDLLLTALAYALMDWHGKTVQGITLEGHGREMIDEKVDTSHTVGWFTVMYPVRLEVKDNLSESIISTKEMLRAIPNRGIGYGAFANEGVDVLHGLPPILFNYLGQFGVQDAVWNLASEESGNANISMSENNVDPKLLNINGMIVENQLRFSIISRLDVVQSELVSASFERHLVKVAEHCEEQVKQNLFRHTPSDFEIVNISSKTLNKLQDTIEHSGDEIQAIYPANSLQEGFIYHAISQPHDDAYRVQFLFDYFQPLNLPRYVSAWQLAVQTYPVLRTVFNWEEELIQICYEKGVFEHQFYDLSELDANIHDRKIEEIRSEDRKTPFTLTKLPLFRLHIMKLSVNHYVILKSAHHSIIDGWSTPLLLHKIHEYYEKLHNEQKDIENISIEVNPETAYLMAQNYYHQNSQHREEFRQRLLSSLTEINDINPLFEHQVDLDSIKTLKIPKTSYIKIEGESYQSIKQMSRKNGITVNTITQFAWHKLLQTYCQSKKTVVGTTISGRELPVKGIENSVGLFINTLPLVVNWDSKSTTLEKIQEIQQSLTELNNYSDISLRHLQKDGRRAFHSLLVFENYPLPEESQNPIDDGSERLIPTVRDIVEKLDYPLTLLCHEAHNTLYFQLKYEGSFVTEKQAIKYLKILKHIVAQIPKKLQNSCLNVDAVLDKEIQMLLKSWSRAQEGFKKLETICELLDAQETSNEISIIYHNQTLTYSELNFTSNQLARYIHQQQQTFYGSPFLVGTPVVIYMDKSDQMVISMLGVLKSGGAYLPMDTDFPEERTGFILKDISCLLILTQSRYENTVVSLVKQYLPDTLCQVISVDRIDFNDISGKKLSTRITADDPAYIIYTSGTTGVPKGITITHENISSLVQNDYIKIRQSDRFTWLSSPMFDASTFEIWTPLASGAKLVIPDDTRELVANTPGFKHWLEENKLSVLWLTKSLFDTIYLADSTIFSNLTTLVVGGEELNPAVVSKLMHGDHAPQTFLNGYGPTESTTFACVYSVNRNVYDDMIPIGKPIRHRQVYVLDENMKVLPVGVVGELYIGGAGLAKGYLNQPDLTKSKFIPNPFLSLTDQNKKNTRLYKTGDLVKWLPNGNLAYVGRNDFQYKIRGFRIELGEIEKQMMTFDSVQRVVVLMKERSLKSSELQKYLIAYYVSMNSIPQDKWIRFLNSMLPEYMIPTNFIQIHSIPLDSSGKLDRKALPEPKFEVRENDFDPPDTEIEILLCKIWQDILEIERVGVNDDFFRIGGDSILSIQLSSRLREYDYECRVTDIFEYRTVKMLGEFLSSKNTSDQSTAELGELEGVFDLLPIQIWFFHQIKETYFTVPNHWNQSFLVSIPTIQVEKLNQVIMKLVNHHDMLRTTFIRPKNLPIRQRYHRDISIPKLQTLDVSQVTEQKLIDILTQWQSQFNIESGPLWQIGYLYGYRDGSARLFCSFHHLIIDTVSWRILVEDIQNLIKGRNLGAKTNSYRQWVQSINEYSKEHPEEQKYWEDQIANFPQYVIEENSKITSDEIVFGQNITDRLLHRCQQAYHTEINDIFLTALVYSLKDWQGDFTHTITLEGHGRENIDPTIDVSRTIGWFTSMYPVRLQVQSSLSDSLKFVKESLRSIPNKGATFGVFSNHQLPPISFNYLGQFGSSEKDWGISHESAGISIHPDNKGHNFLNINGMIMDGQLRMVFTGPIVKNQIRLIVKAFEVHLNELVDHCMELINQHQETFTPSDFSTVRMSSNLLDKLQAEARDQGVLIESIYPANSLQQGFIYHVITQPEDDAYRGQYRFEYIQPVNMDNYIEAWNQAIAKYPILRTAFNWEEELIQICYSTGALDYQIHDLTKYDPNRQTKKIEEWQEKDRLTSFNLNKPQLLRLLIFKLSSNHYVIIKNQHHIIEDGWSAPILIKDVHSFYEQLQHRGKVVMQVDTAYQKAQEYFYRHQDQQKQLWEEKMGRVEQVNDLNPLLDKQADLDKIRYLPTPKTTEVILKTETGLALRELVTSHGVTLNTLIMFAWHRLIQTYTQDLQTVVGTTVSGRELPIKGIEASVGLYINTLPFMVDWDTENSILEQLKQIHKDVAQLNSFSFLVQLAQLHSGGERLFHSLFVFENYPMQKDDTPVRDPKNKLKLYGKEIIEKLDYPLGVIAYESGEHIYIRYKYDSGILSEKSAKNHMIMLEMILQQVPNKLSEHHSSISILSPEQYNEMIYHWNQTELPFEDKKTTHQLFQEQVIRTPNHVAVRFQERQLTYQELNEKSNQLARFIRNRYKQYYRNSLPKAGLITCYFEKGIEMIIGIMATLKAGAAYVPMEPSYPKERVKYILGDTNSLFVLTCSNLEESLSDFVEPNKLLSLDTIQCSDESSDDLPSFTQSDDLVYVLYTSGTTGWPKGVRVIHKSLNNVIDNEHRTLRISNESVVLEYAPLIFDVSVWEMFPALLSGGILDIMPEYLRKDADGIINFLKERKITVATFPPSLLEILPDSDLPNLKSLGIAGESSKQSMIDRWWHPDRFLINAYGPAEVTVCTTMHIYKKGDASTILGTLMDNTKAYVLDKHLKPLPVGVIGELYIGGVGVSQGYHNKQELTQERFLINPFASKIDLEKGYNRMYQTGDMVKWLPNGELEYVSRNDFQVKIRGHRVELEEIENAFTKISAIKQACVVVTENAASIGQQKQLVGFYIEDVDNTELSQSAILDSWQEVYDYEYAPSPDSDQIESDFKGWNSYITREAFLTEHMEKWRDTTVERIKNHHPDSIFEIGVGTGLLMYPLIDYVSRFDGIDISEAVIQRHVKYMSEHKSIKDINLYTATADKIRDLRITSTYDCVIVNSVAQYFPSAEYLKQTISCVLSMLNPGGIMFLGDIRDYRYHEVLIRNRQLHLGLSDDHQTLINLSKKEPELLVSPEYFLALTDTFQNIKVDILEKEGPYCNEINTYRYDVVIKTANRSADSNTITSTPYLDNFNLESSLTQLKLDETLILEDYPNTRLEGVHDIRIPEYSKLSIGLGFTMKCMHYSSVDTNYLTLCFSKNDLYTSDIVPFIEMDSSFYNVPDISLVPQQEIITQLSELLPAYMVPSMLVRLDTFPLSVNGKLDRKALPIPTIQSRQENYEAPTDTLQVDLCNILEEVLGLDRVGIEDDFFRLGGNSILAIQVVHKINKISNLSITVADIFRHKTIRVISQNARTAPDSLKIPVYESDQAPLSYAQERLWFIEQYEQGTNAYHIPMVLELQEGIGIDIIEKSIRFLIDRHHILKTVFNRDKDGQFYQRILHSEFSILQKKSLELESLKKELSDDINHPFSLDQNFPIRVVYYETNKSKNELAKRYLLINIHHIAFDGWSTNILLNEFKKCCDSLVQNQQLPTLPNISIQYKDFASWQRNYLSGDVLNTQINYWKTTLQSLDPFDFPTDFPRPPKIDYSGDGQEFYINPQVSNQLKELAKLKGCTLYTILLCGFYILLNKYSGQMDIVIGTPIANRHYSEIENVIGFFVNSLVVAHRFVPDQSTDQMIDIVHKNLIEAQSYQDMPFEKLVEILHIEKDQSRHPIFTVMFSVQDFDGEGSEYVKPAQLENQYKVAKFDLGISLVDGKDKISGAINFATSLFKKETIKNLVNYYQVILNQLASQDVELIQNYKVLDRQQEIKLLFEWNQTARKFPEDMTIQDLFQEQAKRTPDKEAVIYENRRLSYQQLDTRSNQLASYLIKSYFKKYQKPIESGTVIAVCMDRSIEMLIAIMGILKAGAAYVPIDPNDPYDRIEYIKHDTDSPFLINQKQLDDWPFNEEEDRAPTITGNSDTLAYVIYTSGTTGRPKGALTYQRSLVNRLIWMKEQYGCTEKDCVMQKTPYVFDVSVWELFLPLICGASLVFAQPGGHKDVSYLIRLIESSKITKIHFVPSMLQAFLNGIKGLNVEHSLHSLLDVFCSGETLTPICAKQFKQAFPNVKLHNLYGPTEVAIDVTSYDDIHGDETIIPIGKPIQNINVFVLDQYLNPVGIGAIGELYIRGASKRGGYLNQPELTKERFITNPFASSDDINHERDWLYKTGDLVRWSEDGYLLYIGRNDFQIKIRGFRVEPGEIENRLVSFNQIEQAVVIVKERKVTETTHQKYLVLYYTGDSLIDKDRLKDYLKGSLPDYMVPASFVHMPCLPLTKNGKLDRGQLPEPDFQESQVVYVKPSNDLQRKLCKIWKETLGLSKIGIKENFFNIGGDSIISIRLASLVRELGYPCNVKDIFDYPTIQALSSHLVSRLTSDREVVETEYWKLISRLMPIYKVHTESECIKEKIVWNADLFQKTNKAYHTNTYDLLLLSIMYALERWQPNKMQGVFISRHNSESTQHQPVPIAFKIESTVSQSIKSIKEILRSLPNGKNDEIVNLPKILFNFAEFSQVPEDQSYFLSFNFVISNTGMELYISSYLDQFISNNLVDYIKSYTDQIVDHCLQHIQNNHIEYTLSDLLKDEIFIDVNSDSLDNPVIFLPPGGGGAESYLNNLVPLLKDRRLILFNNALVRLYEIDGGDTLRYYTYESIAAQYIIWLKKNQPVGPYILVGWSFGGILALEIARQLHSFGDAISHLILFDCYFNLKKVIDLIESEGSSFDKKSKEDSLNYRYDLSKNPFYTEAEVILFRATKLQKANPNHNQHQLAADEMNLSSKINRYYVKSTDDNGIFDFIHGDKISIVNLMSDHFNWVDNQQDIDVIESKLRQTLKSRL